jgi:hypothetical protein
VSLGRINVKGRLLSMIIRSAAPGGRPKVNEAAGCLRRSLHESRLSLNELFVDGGQQQAPIDASESRVEGARLIEVSGNQLGPGALEVHRSG